MPPRGDDSASNWKAVAGALVTAVAIGAGVWIVGISLPSSVILTVALAGAALGAAVATFALVRSRALRGQSEKMSADIDAVCRRLVRLEADLAELDRRDLVAPPAPAEEITAEIALLGGLVRDIAVTLAAHDRDLAALKGAEPTAASAPASAAAPVSSKSVPVPFTPVAPSSNSDRIGPLDAGPAAATAKLRAVDVTAPGLAPTSPAPAEPAAAIPGPDPVRADATGEPRAQLDQLADPAREAAVLEAFDHARGVELMLQAIVTLPQRKLKIYEALPGLRIAGEDVLLDPPAFVPTLERHGRLPDLDRMVLARSAVIARHLGARGSEAMVTCALSRASVALPGFLRAMGQFVETHPELAGRLILSLSQRCWRGLDAEGAGALAAIRERGLSFMLDRAQDLRVDPEALAERGVRYVKLGADLLLRPEAGEGKGPEVAPGDLAAALARVGIALVAERVEREEDVPDLIELDAALAQGGVFAAPRAVRADALAPQPAPAGPAPVVAAAPRPSEPGAPERRAFRDFLRRAG